MATIHIFSATFWAALPLIPVSISSNMKVSILSTSARTVFNANIIRLISPPDAILLRGLISSPMLAENINSTMSAPFLSKPSLGSIETLNSALGILKSLKISLMFFSILIDFSFLIWVIFKQIFCIFAVMFCFFKRYSFKSSSLFSIFSNFTETVSLNLFISSIVLPYFFFKSYISCNLSSTTLNSSGLLSMVSA